MLDVLRPGGYDIRLVLLVLPQLVLAALLLPVSAARAAEPSCPERAMNIVAHEDDDVIFQSPALLEHVAAGDCVRTIYVTAGDAGLGEAYWREREQGPRAAYAEMAGVSDTWTSSTPTVAGHTIHLATLTAHPQVSQVNLRLPDGGGSAGTGYAATGWQSVPRLWRSHNPQPESLGPVSSISALDGTATYTYEGLLGTLEALIEEFEPDVISTQNFSAEFGAGDHADHIAVARFAHLADGAYEGEHVLRSYMDYESKYHPVNISEPQLAKKRAAYYAYAAHDSAEACASQAACEEPLFADYWAWLKRQYVVSQSAVPGADAGPAQSVASGAGVTLNGSGSSDPLGHSLSYQWTQTSGPTVTLSNSHAAKPTFTAPTGPATLTFSLVVSNGEASSEADSMTVTVAAPKYALKVSKTGNGSGTVTSSPTGISCGGDCEESYESGKSVTLAASAGSGSEFKGWSGAGCSGTGSCVVSMSAAKEVSAEFKLERHQLSVGKSGAGSGTVASSPSGINCGATCSASFDHGSEVTLTATPTGGSSFVKWTGACSGSGSCKVTMSSAKSVGAEFALIPFYALEVSKTGNGSGTVTSSPTGISCGGDCEESYESGKSVTLAASAGSGSEFKGWSGAGCSGTGSCVVSMSAAKEVSAEFKLERHQLSVGKSGAGSGTVASSPSGINCGATCSASFDHGSEVTLTATPTGGSSFVKWTGACSGSGSCKVTMSSAKSVGAEFALIPFYALEVSKTGNGSGTVTSSPTGISCGGDCEESYESGKSVTLAASAGSGSEFKGWSGAGCSGTGSCVVSMSAAKEVSAEFKLERHQLSVGKSGAGSGTVASSPSGINCGATCSASFDHGSEVTLTATPTGGSSFVKWTGACSGSGSCKVTMSSAKSVGAEFALIPFYALEVSKTGNGSGTVTSSPTGISCGGDCEESYESGKSVTLAASAGSGSEFKGWSGAGCSGTGSCVVSMSAAKEVSAEFKLERHQLSVGKSGAGSGTVASSPSGINCGATCSASFDHGTEVTLAVTPTAGTDTVIWSGCDDIVGANECVVTIDGAHDVTATLNPLPAPPEPEPEPGPQPEPSPTPTPTPSPIPTTTKPSVKLKHMKVTHRRGKVRFVFSAGSGASRFQCALAKTRHKLRYRHCSSPVTYRDLRPGRYVFKVRAVGPEGAKATPVTRKFKLRGVRTRRHTLHRRSSSAS